MILNKQDIGILQIVLVITGIFAFSYIYGVGLGHEVDVGRDVVDVIATVGGLLWGRGGFVSALTFDELTEGVATCLEDKNGEFCTQYRIGECDANCNGACIPSPRDEVAQCQIGACQNDATGICTLGAPRAACEAGGDTWVDDPHGNTPQCRAGCCVIGSEGRFISESQCNRDADLLGASYEFISDLDGGEPACLAYVEEIEEGACVYGAENAAGERQCTFTTGAECSNSIRGSFHAGVLCSNDDLNTVCEPQETTSCITGEPEVYWIDSCGNRENVFGLPKASSFNDGYVQTPDEVCQLGVGGNHLANAATCGACNPLESSICRQAEAGEVGVGNFVCGDLSCTDENGNIRENGESWCGYQGRVGYDEQNDRGTDTPGSNHFRNTCVNGEVTRDTCGDYRTGVCVESVTDTPTGDVSTAACLLNQGNQCLNYNFEDNRVERNDLCNENPGCEINSVDVGDFAFDLCVPEVPGGFDLEPNGRGEGAEGICSLASQTCTKVEVKGFGGWKCKGGCECGTELFTQEMNNLCTSLGDCGASANYLGEYTDRGIRGTTGAALGAGYKSVLRGYADESLFEDQRIEPSDFADYSGSLGIPGFLGAPANVEDPAAVFGQASMITGAAGTVLYLYGKSLAVKGGLIAAKKAGAVVATPSATAASVAPYAGALAGAAIGFSTVSMLLQYTGVGRGLPEALTYSLLAVGTAAGAIIGASALAGGGLTGAGTVGGVAVAGSGGLGGFAAAAAPFAWAALIAVAAFVAVSAILGIGKVRETEYHFSCNAWQPELGGAKCSSCGSDGFPCTEYACQSLGQACGLVNEGTEEVACVHLSPTDITSPVISPALEVISDEHNYVDVTPAGFRLEREGGGADGCLEPNSQVVFGLLTDEYAQCRSSTDANREFDQMENDFGVSRLFRQEHLEEMRVPNLRQLGFFGFIPPETQGEHQMYVKCQDSNGNTNLASYGISFCIDRGIDLTPPRITRKYPVLEFVEFGENEKNVTLWTNEPAECKWDLTDREYDLMSNELDCDYDIRHQTVDGWICNDIFPATEDVNEYYVRCKDNPYLIDQEVELWIRPSDNRTLYSDPRSLPNVSPSERARLADIGNPLDYERFVIPEAQLTNISVDGVRRIQERNTNEESFSFVLRETQHELSISNIIPDNETIVSGVEPTSINFEIETEGGVDGNAICEFNWEGGASVQFRQTGGRHHTQVFQTIYSGDYEIPIMCEDVAGNTASANAGFSVDIDSEPPKVVRAFGSFSGLTIVTDEAAQCRYTTDSCDFVFGGGQTMAGGNKRHSTEFDRSETYYVKCQDAFQRGPGTACSVVVRGQRV